MAKKVHKKRIKKILNRLVLVVIAICILGIISYIGFINKDRFFPKKTPKTTVIVNGEIITSEELDKEYAVAKKQNKMLTKEEFLEDAIIIRLLLQEAAKEGIYVSDEEIGDNINKLIASFGSEEELNNALNDITTTKEALKTQIKRQLLINKLINNTIIANIKVSDSEVKSFYENNKEAINTSLNVSFDNVKDQIKFVLVNEKRDRALKTYVNQLKANADITVGEEIRKTRLEVNRFVPTKDDVCKEDGKPVIRLFTTTTCSQCNMIRDTFNSAVKEFIKEGRVTAYHWELDIGDNILTPEKEDGVPSSEVDIFKKYNSKSTVPTYIFGCKYVRVGNAYKQEYSEGEKKEIKDMIERLIV